MNIMLTMKHIKLTAIVLLCGMALSCGDAIEIPSVPEPDGNGNGPWEEETGPLSGDVVFTGIIEATGGVSWKKGDMISLSDGSSVVSIANTAEDGGQIPRHHKGEARRGLRGQSSLGKHKGRRQLGESGNTCKPIT